MEPILQLRGLSVRFGGNHVLTDVSLDIRSGFTGLIGPNGAGKTTIFNAVTGYALPYSGDALLDGQSIPFGRPVRVARMGLRRSFQTPRLVRELSVIENVLVGVDARLRRLEKMMEFVSLSAMARQTRERASDLLIKFGLGAFMSQPVSSLPLGSQKIVEVVRALIARPRVLLLDEPAAGLSAVDVDRLVEPLASVGKADPLAVIIIEHDLELVSRLCTRVAALHFGKIIVDGTPKEVLSHPEVVSSYVGGKIAARSQ